MPRHGSSHVDSAQKLGRRIVRARGSLSQRQLAKSVGVSAAYISRIERGERVPTLQLLERIAGVLGVDLSWLRGKESAAPSTSQISVAAIEVELDAIEAALARLRGTLRSARG